VSEAQALEVNQQMQAVGRMLQSMINRAEDFQGGEHASVREAPAAYGSLVEFFSSEH
jgi:hypothetical protein